MCGQQPPLSLFWDLVCCTSIAASCSPSALHQCWPPLLLHCAVDSSAGHITLAPHCDPLWVPSVNQGCIWHLPLSSIHCTQNVWPLGPVSYASQRLCLQTIACRHSGIFQTCTRQSELFCADCNVTHISRCSV